MARPRLGATPLTAAERQRRRRNNQQQAVASKIAERTALEAESPELACFQEDFVNLLGDYLLERPALREHTRAIQKIVDQVMPSLLFYYGMEPIFSAARQRDLEAAQPDPQP